MGKSVKKLSHSGDLRSDVPVGRFLDLEERMKDQNEDNRRDEHEKNLPSLTLP